MHVHGRPALVDAGVESYWAIPFSRQRYQIRTMQSAYHNLPTAGSVLQQPGSGYAARSVQYGADDGRASLACCSADR